MMTVTTIAAIMATSWLAYVAFTIMGTPDVSPMPNMQFVGWMLVLLDLFLCVRLIWSMRYDFLNPGPND